MSNFNLRAAYARDSADLAILENMASHGLAQWFWRGAVMMGKAEDAFQWGRDRILGGAGSFGWFNSIVAERDDIILGSAMFYEAEAEEERTHPEPYQPIAELRNMAVGDWYLDSIAVYPDARGQGVGKALFENYRDQGRKLGHNRASLIAEDANISALALYRAAGFEEQDRRAFVPFGTKSKTKNWLLLSAPLT